VANICFVVGMIWISLRMQSSRSALKTLAICSSLTLQDVSGSMFDSSGSIAKQKNGYQKQKGYLTFEFGNAMRKDNPALDTLILPKTP